MTGYADTQLFIDGQKRDGAGGVIDVVDPATGGVIGTVARAGRSDLDDALSSSARAFPTWKRTSAFERAEIMRKAALALSSRIDEISVVLTMEQGKPLNQARNEINSAVEIIQWTAEEAVRRYGRIIPARETSIVQDVLHDPIGPVAAFTPWNFPINQTVLKLAAAVAAGCSIVIKGPEETPASCAALVSAFVDAGLPDGVVNLVYGDPSEISSYLIASPVIRKVSFTGSTPVGRILAQLAGRYLKPITLELGGHAPALVFDDADLEAAASLLAGAKFYNAGQVCISPSRIMVQAGVYDRFLSAFSERVAQIRVGSGLDAGVGMGPLANSRRLNAMEELTADAVKNGAEIISGGERLGNQGNFFAPTILANPGLEARVNREEPFGPLALVGRFDDYADAVAEANRLPYGLAAYAYTGSARRMHDLSGDVEAGMLSINHHGLALPETPFGGVKDSGYGTEGGTEGIEAYLVPRFVTRKVL